MADTQSFNSIAKATIAALSAEAKNNNSSHGRKVVSVIDLAKELGLHKTTVTRELQRLGIASVASGRRMLMAFAKPATELCGPSSKPMIRI